MQLLRRQKQKHNTHFVGRGVICMLIFLILLGGNGAPSKIGDTSGAFRVKLTSSSCDTPPDVQTVSAAEIDIGDTSKPVIALTFDAGGPSAPTARILDTLAKH